MRNGLALAAMVLLFPSLGVAQTAREHVTHIDLNQGVPLVKVRINGQGPFTFVVDTGTNGEAIIAPRLVARLGLVPQGRKNITDLGGHAVRSLDEVVLNNLSVAGAEFHAVRAAVSDLPDGDSVLDGLLGFSLFRSTLLTLDYPHRRLAIGDGSLAGSMDPHVLPMRTPNGMPLVAISIRGAPVETEIDSGALQLSIPASLAARMRFTGGIETVAYGRTQVSSFELRGGTLEGSVQFAGFQFDEPWLEVNPIFSIANLGSAALRDFAVTFDQQSKLLRFAAAGKLHPLLKPRNPANTSPVEELIGTVTVHESY